MKAARWHGRGDVRVEDIPEPTPMPHQALVAVEWCGICGTDLEEFRDGPVNIPAKSLHPLTGRRAPIALGHEIVGRVVERSRDGSGPAVGTLVIPDVVVGCRQCWWCLRHQEGLCEKLAVLGLHADGGLAEYVVATGATCVSVPENVPSAVAALAEPTSVAVRAIRKVARPYGSSLLVIGAGTIGLLTIQAARAAGMSTIVVVDPRRDRRRLALTLLADAALERDQIDQALPELTRGIGPDVVIECSGAEGMAGKAISLARRGGTVVLVGFHGKPERFDLLDTVLAEKQVLGSAAHLWDEDVATAVDMLGRRLIKAERLITARIPLEQVVEAGFGALQDPDSGALKILVTPQDRVG